jgi:[acyl-carrier-protein] S-malonyltransferase
MKNNEKTAYLFPGQGSQKVGMASNLVGHKIPELAQIATQTFEEAEDILAKKILEVCLQGPSETLNDTTFTQPALVVASTAALRMLASEGKKPDIVAGHSLGEYSALVAAEALSFEQALKLVQKRGEYMADAGLQNPGKMAAVLRLPLEQVEQICKDSGAEVANINSAEQIVIAGNPESILYASELARNAKGKVVGLNVSIGSHSSLMKPAEEKLKILLENIDIGDPTIPVVSNVTGNYVYKASEVRRYLVDQLTQRVKWLDTIKLLSRDGYKYYIEVGPGEVLTNLVKRIDEDARTTSTDSVFS